MKYNIHTHKFTNRTDIVEIVNQYPLEFDSTVPFFSIGIHPWYINLDRVEEELNILEEYLKEDNALAVGECGLDKKTEIALDTQKDVFKKQLLIAEKYKKAVIVHCVSAFQEVLEMQRENKISVPLIFHGFSKNEQVAKMILNRGGYLSFGKNLLYNPKAEVVLRTIPLDRIFLETDTLSESIESIYLKASEVLNISIEELELQIKKNAQTVFGFSGTLQKYTK